MTGPEGSRRLRCSFSMLVKQMHNIVQLLYIYVPIRTMHDTCYIKISGVPRNFFEGEGGVTPGILFGGCSTNSVEDRGQRERGSGGGSPLVRGSTQFASE
jgi:hypothetical protein